MTSRTLAMPNTQRGATLIVALIMLLLIAIIGVASMQSTTMQERMAGNMRDQNIAFQAAEAGLRDREAWLESLTARPSLRAWLLTRGGLDLTTTFPFGAAGVVEFGDAGTVDLSQVLADPTMVMEEMEFIPDSLVQGYDPGRGRDFYRVISAGAGQTDNSESVLETTYAKRFD